MILYRDFRISDISEKPKVDEFYNFYINFTHSYVANPISQILKPPLLYKIPLVSDIELENILDFYYKNEEFGIECLYELINSFLGNEITEKEKLKLQTFVDVNQKTTAIFTKIIKPFYSNLKKFSLNFNQKLKLIYYIFKYKYLIIGKGYGLNGNKIAKLLVKFLFLNLNSDLQDISLAVFKYLFPELNTYNIKPLIKKTITSKLDDEILLKYFDLGELIYLRKL